MKRVRHKGGRKTRRRVAVASAAVLLLAAVATVPAGGLIDQLRAAAGLDELLSGRSPGARVGGLLIKTKLPRSLGLRAPPTQRVKSLLRDRPGGPLPDEPAFTGGGALAPDAPVDDLIFAFGGPDIGDVVPPPGGVGGGDIPIVAGAPPIIFGPNPVPTPEPTPVPPGAIPEPATWLTMMLGFGMIGVALRRGRRRAAGAALPNA